MRREHFDRKRPPSSPLRPPALAEGTPLDPATRELMERRFGVDFSAIRIHSDATAEEHDARAYTTGRHIVFAPSQYDPASEAGRWLLGHELAHVVQQAKGRAPDAAAEREADAAARGQVVRGDGGAVGVAANQGVVQFNKNCSIAEELLPFDFTFEVERFVFGRSFTVPQGATSITVEAQASYTGGAPPGQGGTFGVQLVTCGTFWNSTSAQQTHPIDGTRGTFTFSASAGSICYLRIAKGPNDTFVMTGRGTVRT